MREKTLPYERLQGEDPEAAKNILAEFMRSDAIMGALGRAGGRARWRSGESASRMFDISTRAEVLCGMDDGLVGRCGREISWVILFPSISNDLNTIDDVVAKTGCMRSSVCHMYWWLLASFDFRLAWDSAVAGGLVAMPFAGGLRIRRFETVAGRQVPSGRPGAPGPKRLSARRTSGSMGCRFGRRIEPLHAAAPHVHGKRFLRVLVWRSSSSIA